MQITKQYLQEKSACGEGLKWFCQNFPEGGDYQAILDKLAEDDKVNWAQWLLKKVGPLNTLLEIEGNLEVKNLFYAGSVKISGFLKVDYCLAGRSVEAGWSVKAGGSVEAGEDVKAGGSVEAGEDVKAGGSVKAGENVKAGGSVKAGENWGIYAGLRLRISQKDRAVITAAVEPKNIVLGTFQSVEKGDE